MPNFKAKQIEAIRDAVGKARRALREERRFDPLLFATVFVKEGGVQIPGRPEDTAGARMLGKRLLASLRGDDRRHDDADLRRELDRVRGETAWVKAAMDDTVVGFRIALGPSAENNPLCTMLLRENHGLGVELVRKSEILVLQPPCDGTRFIPVHDYELEW